MTQQTEQMQDLIMASGDERRVVTAFLSMVIVPSIYPSVLHRDFMGTALRTWLIQKWTLVRLQTIYSLLPYLCKHLSLLVGPRSLNAISST
jgi:hypothetical protein